MTMTKVNYSLAYEAFISFLKACTLSVVTGILLLLAYSLFSFKIIQNLSYFMQNADAWDPWLVEIKRNWRLVSFAAFMFYLVGTLQFAIIALPTAMFISKGLEADSNRSCFFYVAFGTLIGGLPWISVVLAFGNLTIRAMEENASLIYPGLSSGLFAGIILKRRLSKLTSNASIENSIK